MGIGATIMLVLATAKKTEAMAKYVKAQNEWSKGMERVMGLMTRIDMMSIQMNFLAIAQAIQGINTAMGFGSQRVQFVQSITAMSKLSGGLRKSRTDSRAARSESRRAETTTIARIDKNDLKNLKVQSYPVILVEIDGREFETKVKEITNKAAQST